MDNAIVRKDLNDSLDTDKFRAADGIMGPHHEKEGSYYTIKEVWSPVKFERKEIVRKPDGTVILDGNFNIENRYSFTNIKQCSFSWKLKSFHITSTKEMTGTALAPDIQPSAKGILHLNLPENINQYDVLYITAKDAFNRELFTWSFTLSSPAYIAQRMLAAEQKISQPSMLLKKTVRCR